MRRIFDISVAFIMFLGSFSCAPASDSYDTKRNTCDFEGAYWSALVDSNPNGNNLVNGTLDTAWHDNKSDLAGEVTEPYEGYWEGVALSSHCNKDFESSGTEQSQLVAYVDAPYSGENFIICNSFLGTPAELRFESKRSYIESMMVANTTYSRNAVENGYRMARPLAKGESIWIEAHGYINGSDEVQATSKFYLYKDGAPAFEGWQKWYMTSMCQVDKVRFIVKWSGKGDNNYPAYFAIDDIKVVRRELRK